MSAAGEGRHFFLVVVVTAIGTLLNGRRGRRMGPVSEGERTFQL
jgi:hypothetical protein